MKKNNIKIDTYDNLEFNDAGPEGLDLWKLMKFAFVFYLVLAIIIATFKAI